LQRVPGIGERKAERYGARIIEIVQQTPRLETPQSTPLLKQNERETQRLLKQGRSLAEAAAIRGVKVRTIIETAATLIEEGLLSFRSEWVDSEKLALIGDQCRRLGAARLRALKDVLPEHITYDEIRLVAAEFRRAGSKAEVARTAN